MEKNTTITLDDHFERFIADQLSSGRFNSASEVVRAALRQFENTQERLQILRKALDEGELSGVADYNYEEFMSELDKEIDG